MFVPFANKCAIAKNRFSYRMTGDLRQRIRMAYDVSFRMCGRLRQKYKLFPFYVGCVVRSMSGTRVVRALGAGRRSGLDGVSRCCVATVHRVLALHR